MCYYCKLERHWPHWNVTAVRYGFGDMVLVPHGKFLSWKSWRGLRPLVHYIEVFTAGINSWQQFHTLKITYYFYCIIHLEILEMVHIHFLSWKSLRGLRPLVDYIKVYTAGINSWQQFHTFHTLAFLHGWVNNSSFENYRLLLFLSIYQIPWSLYQLSICCNMLYRASQNLTNSPDGAAHQTNWRIGVPTSCSLLCCRKKKHFLSTTWHLPRLSATGSA